MLDWKETKVFVDRVLNEIGFLLEEQFFIEDYVDRILPFEIGFFLYVKTSLKEEYEVLLSKHGEFIYKIIPKGDDFNLEYANFANEVYYLFSSVFFYVFLLDETKKNYETLKYESTLDLIQRFESYEMAKNKAQNDD